MISGVGEFADGVRLRAATAHLIYGTERYGAAALRRVPDPGFTT